MRITNIKNIHETSTGEHVTKEEPYYTVSGNVNCYSNFGKSSEFTLMGILYDRAILLGVYKKKNTEPST